ncbi:MarR family winged helix-turn-helix transcriptional regulator [Isoptericola sp. NEAU-Y5]|uniref:MarR family winged helix-turn-helix transcriptional regulator n=1 Tax=Isoptericola luteus TaxID=2879484 RepID=A0ABS7ZB62_9MICO|nr:MarR family winged helix-turn-helix transcriptional regulator [Isoptericola sp. NEAU-Y5]MCA5892298.1 MarR family winged helix-turn-helix transcriptional regulator [Isoptericola sp. NEAU-Y5]
MTTSSAPTASAEVDPSPLGWSLAALLREWSARVAAACADVPHGGRGYEVLAAVARDAPPTQAALAARLGIDRTVMTYLLDELVGCGLVERRADPADRRARRIVATDHGRAVLTDLDGRVRTAEDALLAGLAPADRDVLRHLLERAATSAAPGDDRCAVVARAVDPRAVDPAP